MHKYNNNNTKKKEEPRKSVAYCSIDCISHPSKTNRWSDCTRMVWQKFTEQKRCLRKAWRTVSGLFIYLCIFLLLRFEYTGFQSTKYTKQMNVLFYISEQLETKQKKKKKKRSYLDMERLIVNCCVDQIRTNNIDVPPYKVVIKEHATNIIVIDTLTNEE